MSHLGTAHTMVSHTMLPFWKLTKHHSLTIKLYLYNFQKPSDWCERFHILSYKIFVGNMQWSIQILHYIFLIIFLLFWVLLMFSRAKTHKNCSKWAHPSVADRGSPLNGRFSGYIWKAWSWTIAGNMFGECHVFCMPELYLEISKKSKHLEVATKD